MDPNHEFPRQAERWKDADNQTDLLSEIEKYSPNLVDGGVVAYPVDKTFARRSIGMRDAEFTIKAQVLKAKAETAEAKADAKVAEEPTKLEEAAKETKDEL